MSINGITNSGLPLGPGQIPTRDGVRSRTSPATGAPSGAPPASTGPSAVTSTGRAPQALPASPPPGTDPALWSVLSTDERAHFAKLGTMGPLTYGRVLSDMRSGQIPSARGGRLDVKV
ncbi:MAG TPA: hypothetical protein VMH39_17460 [Gemmatimonadaceae bacterium]|nr:hypothetical protein [Gemmatimonadaceae bacterium]